MAKIGFIQVDNKMPCVIEERQNALIALGESCLKQGADLVFFPEFFQYVKQPGIRLEKERLKKLATAWQERCAALAKKYHAYVVPWDYYVNDDGKVFNSAYILDREGNFIGRYCKCNLTHAERSDGVVEGLEYPVFDLDIGRIGIIICFDNYFPESVAALANQGADLVLYPLYGDTLKPQWELKLRARATDHTLYMASCQISSKLDIAYTGVADPEGNVIARLEEVNTYRVVDIDIGKTVWSNTAAKPGQTEDLRAYLHKCRNFAAFGSLATQGTPSKEWDEIIFHENN